MKTPLDQIADLQKQVDSLNKKYDALLEFIKHAQVSSGVCCCGDSLEGHPSGMDCGHEPVDVWDYAVSKFVEGVEKEKLDGNDT